MRDQSNKNGNEFRFFFRCWSNHSCCTVHLPFSLFFPPSICLFVLFTVHFTHNFLLRPPSGLSCLSVCLSPCPVCLSICQSACLLVCLPVSLSCVSTHLSLSLSPIHSSNPIPHSPLHPILPVYIFLFFSNYLTELTQGPPSSHIIRHMLQIFPIIMTDIQK